MAKERQKTTIKALFEKDRKILLVKDTKGVWELPGGRIEHNEEPEQALRRELQEELGWSKIDITNMVNSWSFSSEVDNIHYHFIVLVYACTSDEKIIKENEEYTEYSWIPIDKIKDLNMRDGYKDSIQKYLDQK